MNTKLIQSLAKLAKVTDIDAFTAALQSETDTDFSLDAENLIVRTKDEDETLRTNLSNEVKKKAFTDAFEIQIKNMKTDLGLEFEGKKQEDFISAFKSKILDEATIEPNQKITDLEKSLENLKKVVGDKDNELSKLQNSFMLKENRLKAQSLIPNLPENIGLSKDEAVDLFFLKHEIKEDGIYKDGIKLKDNLENDKDLGSVINDFVSEKGWNEQPKPIGRGGGSGKPSGQSGVPTTLEEYDSYLKEKGLNPGSQEANAILNEIVKNDV